MPRAWRCLPGPDAGQWMASFRFDFRETPPDDCRGGAISIGNFDGVHRGHAALVAELRRQATVVHGPAVAVTFDPPPLRLLQPEQFQPPLTTVHNRAELLHARGADHVLVIRTTPELLQLSAAEFFREVVCTHLGARAMVEGENFGFGHNREGNIATLRTLCERAGVAVDVLTHQRTAGGTDIYRSHVCYALVRSCVELATSIRDASL